MAPCQAPSTGALATDIAADLRSAALEYARRGWAVFPCKPDTKVPMTANGFRDATTDEAIIRRWWTDQPRSNIGLPTGARNRIWATDLDVKNGVNGAATLAALEEAHGKLPPTIEQMTPSGGRHLIFLLDSAPVRNTVGKLGPGIDTRGEGGYIVVAPSVVDGKPYHWIADPWATPPAPAPKWLLNLLAAPARKAPGSAGDNTFDGDLHPYVERALREECANVALAKEGTRNATLNAAAFNLGQLVGGGVLPQGRAKSALANAAQRCGLGPEEIERTLRSGLEAGMQEPRGVPDDPPSSTGRGDKRAKGHHAAYDAERSVPSDGAAPGPKQPEKETANDRLKLYRWHELKALPEPEPLVDDLLDRAAMSVFYGPSGCGKSFLALDLGARVALGWEFFGLASRPGPVVYIAAEPGRGLRRRLEAFARQHLSHDTAPRLEEIPFAILPAGVDLCDPNADTGPIIARITAMFPGGVALVEIDTLSRAMPGYNENSPEDMTAFVRNCDRIRAETRGHVLIVHHSGKDVAAGSRGHSSLRAATDTEIEVVRDEASKIITAKVTKQRDREIIERPLTFRLATVTLRRDSCGKDVTSCVVEPTDEPAQVKAKRKRRLSPRDTIALDQLARAIAQAGTVPPANNYIPAERGCVTYSLWASYCEKAMPCRSDSSSNGSKPNGSDSSDSLRRKIDRARESLQAQGIIGVFDKWVWIA